jgi:hypothetical protein
LKITCYESQCQRNRRPLKCRFRIETRPGQVSAEFVESLLTSCLTGLAWTYHLRSNSGSNGPIAKECHRFLVAGPFKFFPRASSGSDLRRRGCARPSECAIARYSKSPFAHHAAGLRSLRGPLLRHHPFPHLPHHRFRCFGVEFDHAILVGAGIDARPCFEQRQHLSFFLRHAQAHAA